MTGHRPAGTLEQSEARRFAQTRDGINLELQRIRDDRIGHAMWNLRQGFVLTAATWMQRCLDDQVKAAGIDVYERPTLAVVPDLLPGRHRDKSFGVAS